MIGLRSALALPLALGALALAAPARGQDDPKELAKQASAVLQKHCQACHDGKGSKSGYEFDVRKAGTLKPPPPPATPNPNEARPVVVPGKAAESKLVKVIETGRMPPDGDAVPAAELAVLKKWIDAGAPDFSARTARPFIPLIDVMTAVSADLRKARATDEDAPKYRRYFMLTHVHNNNSVPEDRLIALRAALSKALNSLHWKPDAVVVPQAVPGTADTVFALDLRAIDWHLNDMWGEVLKEYPYGLRWNAHPENADLRALDKEVVDLTGVRQPIIRGDWFLATATRPPLYHTLMFDAFLPDVKKRKTDKANPANPKHMTAADLEAYLGVKVQDNLANPNVTRVARGGFAKSGVSGQNRLVERHPIKGGGYYWLSYDFRADNPRGKLTRFPLGPLGDAGEKHPFVRQAFVQDGGEIIFTLPNNMQGYLLIDAKGARIDAGPIDVVGDKLFTSGTAAVVTGVSCMACHARGMIPFTDEVRTGHTLTGFNDAAKFVERMYPDAATMKGIVARDQKRFTEADDAAVVPFLKNPADREKLGDPVGPAARRYRLEFLDLEALACDVFEPKPENLKAKLGEDRFRALGLNPVGRDGGVLGRLEWEATDYWEGLTLMQLVAAAYGASPIKK